MRRPFALTTTLLLVALSWCASAFALNPDLDVNQYAHTTWRIRDGLVKGVISSLAQTPDGYLWLGTESGLFQFDGVRAVRWKPPSSQQMPGTLITALLSTSDGALWVGTFTGLASWKQGKLTEYPELEGQNVQSLLEASDGTLWAGVYKDLGQGEVCEIRNGLVHCQAVAAGVRALYQDHNGVLWVGSQKGFWRWKPAYRQFFSVPDNRSGVSSFAEIDAGELLLGISSGIRRVIDGRIEPYEPSEPLYSQQVKRMLRDHDGGMWVGTGEHGLVHIHAQGRRDAFSSLDGLSGDYVTAIFEDREGSIWVATYDGLDRFRAYAIPTISTKQGLSNTGAWSVLASRDGRTWIATNGGLNLWKDGRISLFSDGGSTRRPGGRIDEGMPFALFQDSKNRIWVSNDKGEVGYLQDGHFIPISGLRRGLVNVIAEAPAGHLWASDQQLGLLELYAGRENQQIPWRVFGHEDFAKAITADPSENGIWLGFQRGGVTLFADGEVRASYSVQNGLGKGSVTDLRLGDSGELWVATTSGLSRIKNGRITTLTSKNGLPCDQVVATMEDDDRSTWLNLSCGLVRITKGEMAAWIVDPGRVLSITLFDASDGVRSHAAGGGNPPLMTKSADGRIWFLPWDGVSIIDPHHLPFNSLPPPVHVEQVMADGKTYDAADGLHLPPHVRDLSIEYTALSLVVPERVHFKVKLEGQDSDWRELVNVRHVDYTNLPPRSYRFRVIACNNSGVWNETGASLEFSIAPAYYQTTWFKILCAFALMAMLWVLYQLRLRQIRQQFAVGLEARVGERLRIARELHDTLLQSFQGVMLQFQAARNMVSRKPDDAVHALDEAIAATAQAIVEGRDAIQDLRPDLVSQRDLAEMLNTTGRELGSAHTPNGSSPSFRLVVEGKQRELSPILQDEVYRITREVIRNAFQHADAGNIEAEIHYDAHQLRLRIRDDGKGIDSEIVTAGGRSGHWGITGIRERAQRVGADLKYWTELGAGTEVELRIPAAIAYEKQRNGHTFRLFPKAGGDERRS